MVDRVERWRGENKMTETGSSGRRVILEWHVRPSLLTYLQRTPDFVVTVEGGPAWRPTDTHGDGP